jgi:tRNA-2-methylthio-N6-dimethylallyladenosine synthase
MTSHPSDISERLLDVMGAHPKIMPFLHLPVQAGNNRVLEMMNRPYTRERYLDIVRTARAKVPNIALSTDIIVGFPTETDAEFRETFELMSEVRYDTAFLFKYSARPLTKAERLGDDIPDEVKVARLEQLIARQQEISKERNLSQLGRETEILVEGPAPKSENMWTGRTSDFRPVVVSRNGEMPGELIRVRLKELHGFTFVAERY